MYCPGANETVCDPVYCMPFSLKETPLGTLIVTPSSAAKLAVTDCGALIVTVVEAEVEEATEPVQLGQARRRACDARNGTDSDTDRAWARGAERPTSRGGETRKALDLVRVGEW